MSLRTRIVAGTLGAVAVLGSGGCSDDGVSGPEVGTLEVLLTMEGADQDPDGGTLYLNGEEVGTLAVNVRWQDRIEAGIYVLMVAGITPNCSIIGTNERNVTVRAGEVAQTEFLFLCESTEGKDPGDVDGPAV